jgi:hypothetical protein
MKTNNSNKVVTKLPRLPGEVKPNNAQNIELNVIARIWTPEPTNNNKRGKY